jgi:molybdenum cofactor cytidylyltransferase
MSSELFSELVRMEHEQDLRRLAARYPSVDVEVADPGVHMAMEAQADLNQLRAQLTGPLLPGGSGWRAS